METRPAAVAGTFYPGDRDSLRLEVETLLEHASEPSMPTPSVKALIVPHAGYIYSGPVAASAYKLLTPLAPQIRRVILLGPSHRVPLRGIAAPNVGAFHTPLGAIPLDREALESLAELPEIQFRDDAHAWEHSLEVQLPFLQTVLGEFTLVPLVVGLTRPEAVTAVIERFWDQADTLVVISSDLSHFHSYDRARRIDAETTRRIEQLDDTIVGEEACGCHPLNGLLQLVKQKGLSVQTLDLRNSGDTAGDKEQVVGYGSYVVCG